MKIAVLWVSWFIWSHCMRFFANAWIEVDGYSRSGDTNTIQEYWLWYYFDLEKMDTWQTLLSRHYDCVVYCIWDSSYGSSSLTHKDLQKLINSIHCNHFIYISSSSVYMWEFGELYEEHLSVTSNLNTYSKNKILEEQVVLESPLPKVTILRPRAVYWTQDRVLLYNILKSAIYKKTLYLSHDKTLTSSLTSINTLTQAIYHIIIMPSDNSHAIYNISDTEPYTLHDIFSSVSHRFFWTYCLNLPLGRTLHKLSPFSDTIKWYQDVFWWDKVLNTNKIKDFWFTSSSSFYNELPNIHHRRTSKLWSVSAMKTHWNSIPWMI